MATLPHRERPPRILLITPTPPLPATSGNGQRTDLLWRALSQVGDVDLMVTLGPPGYSNLEPQQERELSDQRGLKHVVELPRAAHGSSWTVARAMMPRKLANQVASQLAGPGWMYRSTPQLIDQARQLVADNAYDLVVARYAHSLARSGWLGLLPTILDIDDVDTQVHQSRLDSLDTPTWKRPLVARRLRQVRRPFERVLAECDHLFVAKEADRGLVSGPLISERAISVLPNIAYTRDGATPQSLPPNDASRRMLFVGSFGHPPNLRGVDYFIQEVWPRVQQHAGSAELELVGGGIPGDVQQRWRSRQGVVVTGFADDLDDAYRRSAFSIAPLLTGAGTNIKVLESLGHGRAVVVTAKAHQGFEASLPHGTGVLVGDSAESLAENCVSLLETPARRNEIAAAGYEVVTRLYNFDHFAVVVADAMRNVLASQ